MTEAEVKALEEAVLIILSRHAGEDKKAVAAFMIETIVDVYDSSEGGIVQ